MSTSTTLAYLEGSLAYYHPNQTGTGTAARFELRPARRGREGYIFAEMARQKSLALRQNGNSQAATFDWENRIGVKLGLNDVCAMLAVLEGRMACAGGDKGLFHQSAEATAAIAFKRVEQPFAGFSFEVSRKARDGNSEAVRMRLAFSEAEGCGLRQVFSAAIFHLCFYAAPAPRRPAAGEPAEAE